jgi:hypothetical protein
MIAVMALAVPEAKKGKNLRPSGTSQMARTIPAKALMKVVSEIRTVQRPYTSSSMPKVMEETMVIAGETVVMVLVDLTEFLE